MIPIALLPRRTNYTEDEMVVATMPRSSVVESAERITRPEVLAMIRETIRDKDLSPARAIDAVYAELVADGLATELAELFVRAGMHAAYAGAKSKQRTGEREPEDVDADIVESDRPVDFARSPDLDRPSVVSTSSAPAIPNASYDPERATGAGDRAYRVLPSLSGMLAAEWWVGDGKQKPLGHMTAAEVDRAIEHNDGMATPYLHRVKFLMNIRVKMKGKPGEIVADTSPDPGQVKILWDCSKP